MGLVIFSFCAPFLLSIVLAQRIDDRKPYDRRAVLVSLGLTAATTAGLAPLAVWWVRHDYADTHEVVALIALTVGMSLGLLAGRTLADARRRRSGATD